MKFIERLKRGYRAATSDSGAAAQDERLWAGAGYGRMSAAGVRVSPELALSWAPFCSCVRVVTETLASFPLIMYKRLPDGGKERADQHPLYSVLHDKPNSWMTAFEWVELMQTHIEMRGNAYNFIQPGSGRAVDELLPIHPDRVTIKRLPGNRLRYEVRTSGQIEAFSQEQILHFRGQTLDGVLGIGTVALGAEVIGAGLGQQDYSARFWANDSKPGGVLEHPQKLSPEAYVRLKDSFQEAQVAENRHKVAILEEGIKYNAIATSNKDSQFLETIQARRSEICGMMRVPPHKISDLTRATFSNIESQNIEFYTDGMRPRAVRFEKRLKVDLIDPMSIDGEEYFAEFQMDAMLRGDLKSRYEAYAVAIDHGWMSPNDARRMDNMNPIEDGDIYIRQMNTVPLGTDPATVQDEAPAEDDTATGAKNERRKLQMKRLKQIAESAAERCVRKEVKGLRVLFEKEHVHVPTDQVPSAMLDEFYESHCAFIMQAMCIDRTSANQYIQGSKAAMETSAAGISTIEKSGAQRLAALAVKTEAA